MSYQDFGAVFDRVISQYADLSRSTKGNNYVRSLFSVIVGEKKLQKQEIRFQTFRLPQKLELPILLLYEGLKEVDLYVRKPIVCVPLTPPSKGDSLNNCRRTVQWCQEVWISNIVY